MCTKSLLLALKMKPSRHHPVPKSKHGVGLSYDYIFTSKVIVLKIRHIYVGTQKVLPFLHTKSRDS